MQGYNLTKEYLMKLCLTLLLILLAIVGISAVCKEVSNQMELADAESECIAQYISSGIERKHISVSSGSCSVRY